MGRSGHLIHRIFRPSEHVVPCPLASTVFNWKLLSLSPCMSSPCFSCAVFKILCFSMSFSGFDVSKCDCLWLILLGCERPRSYADVCRQAGRVSTCPHVALCSPPRPLGLSLRSRGSAYVLLSHRPPQTPDLVVPRSGHQTITCLFCRLVSAVGSLWCVFRPGLCNFNSRTAIWFLLIISVFVDILYLLSHFTMFFFNYLNMVFCIPLNIFVTALKLLSAYSDI